MKFGVNYPGGGSPIRTDFINSSEGWDFGPIPWSGAVRHWTANGYRNFKADLDQMHAGKIRAIRWWLLGGGTNFGTGSMSPRLRSTYTGPLLQRLPDSTYGLSEDLKNVQEWEVQVPDRTICDQIIADFCAMLEVIRDHGHGIKIMPVILDYRFFEVNVRALQEGATELTRNPANAWLGPMDPGKVNQFNAAISAASGGAFPGCRWGMIESAEKRYRFFSRFLIPLLSAVNDRGLSAHILAWDIGNELDIEWQNADPPYSPDHPIFKYISESTRLIRGEPVEFPGVSEMDAGMGTQTLPISPARPGVAGVASYFGHTFVSTVGWLRASAIFRSNRPDCVTGEDILQFHAYAHAHESPGTALVPAVRSLSPRMTPPISSERFVFGRDAVWWEVPSSAGFGSVLPDRRGQRRKVLIGEVATNIATGFTARDGVDPRQPDRRSERWPFVFKVPATSVWPEGTELGALEYPVGAIFQLGLPGSDPRTFPRRTRENTFFYSPANDTFRAHMVHLDSLGYEWVFLWEWNHSAKEDSRIRTDPYTVSQPEIFLRVTSELGE